MNIISRSRSISLCLLALTLPGVFAARLYGHGDVWAYTDTAQDRLAIGLVDELTYTPGERVFESILAPEGLPFSPFDFSASEPGFRAQAGDLPASQAISLTVNSLQVWNGSDLDPVVDVDFSFDLSGGFNSSADGSLHEHVLLGLASLTATPVPDGVYVASVRAGTAGLGDSDAFFMVLLKDDLITSENDVEELEELLEAFEGGGAAPMFGGKDFSFFEDAVEFVESVPEPSAASLAGLASLLGAVVIRQR
jgi:hypothetical protein